MMFLFFFLCTFHFANATVIIVGAGISGLGAARRLREGGVEDFIILEARNVVGGRMQGFAFGGYDLQPGAAWIVGTATDSSGGMNPMWEFAQEIGLDGSNSDFEDLIVYDWNGRPQSGMNRHWNEYCRAEEGAAEFADTLDPTLDESYAISQGDIYRQLGYQSGYSGANLWISDLVTWSSFDWDEAMAPNATAARGLVPYITAELWGCANFYTRGGFGRIADHVASDFMDKIVFNQAVVGIQYGADGVTVTTIGGEQYHGDQVISTVSIGVLKSAMITWSPPLPAPTQERINRFSGDNVYNKLFLQFDAVFWGNQEYFYHISQRRGEQGIIINMNHNNYEPGSRILLFEQVDEEGRRWEQEPLEQSVERAMGTLRLIWGNNIPQPTNTTKVLWGIDPFFRMSYSSWPVGFSINDYAAMCAPVGNQLFFGGEHCSPEFYGFTHGAYIRGIAAAEELLSSINMLKETKLNPMWCKTCPDAPKFTGLFKGRLGPHLRKYA